MREGLHKVVSDDETIVAISTPPGHGAIGIVRLSGRECRNIANQFFRPSAGDLHLQHRFATIGRWNDATGQAIDEVVITFFQAPHSYTGEDVLEISAHGNPSVLGRILETTRAMGVRVAGPGEFTLRAVVHGKMDLVQAEAVREFVAAQTDQQARIALRQLEGALSNHIRPIKAKLLDVIAQLEAGIDFAEDEIEQPATETLRDRIQQVRVQLEALKETFGYGKILATGLRLAILGKPNVGKSSLFNRLVASDRAIVTEIPGTTRDVISETVSIDGVPLSFADTAGIRPTTDVVESIGVKRTIETLAEADLAIIVFDGSSLFDDNDRNVLDRVAQIPHLVVINKSDLPQVMTGISANGAPHVSLSARTGSGVDELRGAIREFILSRRAVWADDLTLTSARQYEAVNEATEGLIAAERTLGVGAPLEILLLDLYRTLGALGELTGEVVTEDILDRIFSTFCVGK